VRLLVDSQSLIWYVDQDHFLSPTAHAAITDPSNELLVSAATVWEIAIKVGLKKLTLSFPYRVWMEQAIADLDLIILPIMVEVANVQADLPWHHRDPFDRLIIAQALVEDMPVVSIDEIFDQYGIKRMWHSA
jgi:PIN domain nuclease of toxin-antitoxin system